VSYNGTEFDPAGNTYDPSNPLTRLATFGNRSYLASNSTSIVDLPKPERVDPTRFPLVRLTGFFQLDSNLYDQNAASQAALGDAQNGVGFRRARLQAVGNVAEFTTYSLEMDFATAGRPSFLDVWGEQQNLPIVGNVRIGHFRQPTTMDALTSIRHLEFLERSAPFQAMDPFRRVGIMAWDVSQDQMTTWANSVYATGFTLGNSGAAAPGYGTLGDTRFATQLGDNGGVSYAGRVTHLLFYDEPSQGRYLMHVGAGYNYSNIPGNGGTPGPANGKFYQARSIPETFIGDPAGVTGGNPALPLATPFVINTGQIAANSFNYYHLEWAANYGPAHAQAEWMATSVNQFAGPAVFYDGAYVQTGYFLTGESCGYNKNVGVLDYNVRPFREFVAVGRGRNRRMCGWGAWEVAARYSYLDLRNIGATTQLAAASVNTGVLSEGTLALNWWWNSYTRVQFNYIFTDMASNIGLGNQQMNTAAARYQIEF
jgi:phosphate-selective porin OprO/OprP